MNSMNFLIKNCVSVFLLLCIVHVSVVKGDYEEKCKEDTYKLFPISDLPHQNFLNAFMFYNLDHFNHPDVNNSHARGYFEDLINSVEIVSPYVKPPSIYCGQFAIEIDKLHCNDGLFMLFADTNLNTEEEVTRINNMTDIEAFKHIYLTQNNSTISYRHFYPESNGLVIYAENIEILEEDNDELRQETEEEEDERKRRLIMYIILYVLHLSDAADMITQFSHHHNFQNREFKSVADYCEIAARAAEGSSSSIRAAAAA